MDNSSESSGWKDHTGLIRIGGAAMLLGLSIHIFANGMFRVFPPEGASLAELQTYLAAQAEPWARLHGIRYLAVVSIAIFGAGLFVRTTSIRPVATTGWGAVGLIGTVMWVVNLFIVNGIETMTFMQYDELSHQADTFWAQFYITRTLFTAETVAWSVFCLGFSIAGLQSGTLPKWLAAVGLFSAANGLLVGIFIVPVMKNEWQGIFMDLAALPGMIWFVSVAILMVWRGSK